jgi:hypothetical protein
VFNFSKEPHTVKFTDGPFAGAYHDAFSGEAVELKDDTTVTLAPWDWRVLVK